MGNRITRIGWTGAGALLCATLLATVALGMYHWSHVDLFYKANEKVNEFYPEVHLVQVEGTEQVLVVFQNVDDRTDEWLYSIGYHLWNPSTNSKVRFEIPGTDNDIQPSVVSDGSNIWVFYDPEGKDLEYGILDPLTGDWIGEPNVLETDSRFTDARNPSATYIQGGEIWLAFTGFVEASGKAKKGGTSTLRDIYLMRGTIVDADISWFPEVRLTDDPDADYDPSIIRTINGETWLAWRSRATGEYQIWTAQIVGDELINPRPVTTFSGWYPHLQDRAGEVWLYYTMWQGTAGCKRLNDPATNTWSNFVRLSDARERVKEPTPITLPQSFNTPDSGYHDLLVFEKTQWAQIQYERYYLTRMGYAARDGDVPKPPHTEMELESAEYLASRATLQVQITVTEPVDYILLSGNTLSGLVWEPILDQTGQPVICLDLDGDLIYEFKGQVQYISDGDEQFYDYLMGTSVRSGDPRPSTFDVMHVSIKTKPPKKK